MSAPGQANSQLTVSLLPFGPQQHVLLARDISQLNRLERIRRDFVVNVSHELRTPLAVINGYLELLSHEDVPQLASVLDEMRLQSKRIGQIVQDLLTLSRLETQHRADDERVSMTALLVTARKEAEALSQGRHSITMEMGTDGDPLGSLKDSHSALSNLASNAVRYTPAGGSITIRWKLTPNGAAFSVRDTGFGISAPHLARLTERFYRVSSSRSRGSDDTAWVCPSSNMCCNCIKRTCRLKVSRAPALRSPATLMRRAYYRPLLAAPARHLDATPWHRLTPWARMWHA